MSFNDKNFDNKLKKVCANCENNLGNNSQYPEGVTCVDFSEKTKHNKYSEINNRKRQNIISTYELCNECFDNSRITNEESKNQINHVLCSNIKKSSSLYSENNNDCLNGNKIINKNSDEHVLSNSKLNKPASINNISHKGFSKESNAQETNNHHFEKVETKGKSY
jgi:hypothetical protein